MNKTDRLIIIACIGIFSISMAILYVDLRRQKLFRENLAVTEKQMFETSTQDIEIWRRYHEQQMFTLGEILQELRLIKTQCKTHNK